MKSVHGKCTTCAMLSGIRRHEGSAKRREAISRLFLLHRMSFMAERRGYYKRRMQAAEDPENFMSVIMDGMAQSHSELPYQGGLNEFSKKLKCHLQGAIMHGKGFTVYRTYHNVKPGSNLAIYVWLSQLEALMQGNGGKLPDTVYLQIDGGAENANFSLLAIAELLVAKKLTRKVIITP